MNEKQFNKFQKYFYQIFQQIGVSQENTWLNRNLMTKYFFSQVYNEMNCDNGPYPVKGSLEFCGYILYRCAFCDRRIKSNNFWKLERHRENCTFAQVVVYIDPIKYLSKGTP